MQVLLERSYFFEKNHNFRLLFVPRRDLCEMTLYLVNDDDLVCILHGRQSVRDQDDGATLQVLLDRLLHLEIQILYLAPLFSYFLQVLLEKSNFF